MATVGAGALTFGGAVLPAAADDSADEPVQLLASSADKYELAAARTGESATSLEQKEDAGLISVSDLGFYYHKDEVFTQLDLGEIAELKVEASGAAIPGNPAEGSRPGAPVTVYLDFDGETLEGTHWNTESGITTLDFAPAASVTNRDAVWAAVAEDYAPFNVNVTTTHPGDDALYKTSADDNEYGSHVIITDSYTDVLPMAEGSGGIAWLGGTGSEYLQGALVFTEGTEGSAKVIAEIASHESGHNFGLEHDGIAGSDTGEYYVPEEGLWAPIMGAGYYVPVTHWSNGGYAGATNDEDDLSILTDRSAGETIFVGAFTSDGQPYEGSVCVEVGDPANPQPGDVYYVVVGDECGEQLELRFTYTDRADYAADEIGDTPDTASVLNNEDGTFADASVIETTTDVDVFAVTTAGGEITADVEVANVGPNLDAKLTLTDASGAILDENDPDAARDSDSVASGLGASVSAEVEAGTYYLSVEGVGFGAPETATPDNANGYTAYGSLGNYSLSGTAEPLETEALVITSPEDGSDVTGGAEIEVTGTATPNATVTLSVGGSVVDTVTADEDGNWNGTVTANQYGNTEIVATQALDDIAIPGSTTVTVVAPPAPVAAPVITGPANGATIDTHPVTISGTGVAGAVVTVTIEGPHGEVFSGQALVAENGTWWIDVDSELANADYTVSAVQTLNGVTSDPSAEVAFTVAVSTNGGGGDDNGTGNDDDNLATTGSDFNAAPFAAMAAVLLLVGGGIAIYARRKSLTQES